MGARKSGHHAPNRSPAAAFAVVILRICAPLVASKTYVDPEPSPSLSSIGAPTRIVLPSIATEVPVHRIEHSLSDRPECWHQGTVRVWTGLARQIDRLSSYPMVSA